MLQTDLGDAWARLDLGRRFRGLTRLKLEYVPLTRCGDHKHS